MIFILEDLTKKEISIHNVKIVINVDYYSVHFGENGFEFKDLYAVCFKFKSKQNQSIYLSNSIIITMLENYSKSDQVKPVDRVYKDPSCFYELLEQFSAKGSQELADFFNTINIPLNLRISYEGFTRERESNGNIEGKFNGEGHTNKDSSSILSAFGEFLDGLFSKLVRIIDFPNIKMIDTYLNISYFIFTSVRFLLDYISEKHVEKIFTVENWDEVKNFYDFMVRYIDDYYKLIWLINPEQVSLKEKIDKLLKKNSTMNAKCFENLMIERHSEELNNLYEIQKRVLLTYKSLKNISKLQGNVILSETDRHPYLFYLKDTEETIQKYCALLLPFLHEVKVSNINVDGI